MAKTSITSASSLAKVNLQRKTTTMLHPRRVIEQHVEGVVGGWVVDFEVISLASTRVNWMTWPNYSGLLIPFFDVQ